MKKTILAAVAVLSTTSAFAYIPNIIMPNPIAVSTSKLEAVLVTEITQIINKMPSTDTTPRDINSSLKINVMSNGCTKAEDFDVRVVKVHSHQLMSIIRTNPDVCEETSHVESIDLGTTALLNTGKTPVRIANPFLVDVQVVY